MDIKLIIDAIRLLTGRSRGPGQRTSNALHAAGLGSAGHVHDDLAGGGVHGVATAHVGGGGVGADGLEGARHGGGGDVGGTEVVHGGGVGPVVVDGRGRGEHALVGAGHGVGHGRVGVSEPSLGGAEGGIGAALEVGAAEEEASGVGGGGVEVHAARVGADARRELLEVVDGVEHYSAGTWRQGGGGEGGKANGSHQ
jgi:hypothetical protein